MGKPVVLVALILFLAEMGGSQAQHWHKSMKATKVEEKVTDLHFYFHDTASGKNPSSVRVAQAANSQNSSTLFGIVLMADDPLTEGPELYSKEIGRAQGLYGSADQNKFALIMALSYSFTDGIYNGSSFSIMGRNPTLNPEREMPIVGGSGTGVFQRARGSATAKTYFVNATTGDAIVEYFAKVYHY